MAALTAGRLVPDTKLWNSEFGGYIIDFQMAATDTIFKGSYVEFLATGYVQPAGVGTSLQGAGIALETVINAGAAGAKTCPILVGAVIEAAVTTVVIGMLETHDLVYASDDQTLTTTAGTSALMGWVVQLTGTARGLVQMGRPGQTVA